MLDISELKGIQANITTVRLMNPLNHEIEDAVRYWDSDMRFNGQHLVKIDPSRIKVSKIQLKLIVM